MGSCASVHHKSTQESAIKLGVSFGSKRDNLVIPESPFKDKHVNGDPPIKTLDDYGSKDETFFDSQPWLESDCEDDFFSVNGEFTPSRGSTPIHHNFFMGTPKINKTPLEDRPPGSIPEPSPTGKKKRLSELFKESLREESVADDPHSSEKRDTPAVKKEVKPTILDVLPKSPSSTPYISGANSVCSSERTANGDALLEREKSIKSAQCCLPSLISCRSFRERKKKMSPPRALAVNDKA